MASGCRGVLIFIRAGKYPPGKRLFVMSAIQFSAQWAPLLREVNWISILVRLCLAIFCGGVIGIERGRKWAGMPRSLESMSWSASVRPLPS